MSGEDQRKAVGSQVPEEEETGTGAEGGGAARGRGAGCRGELLATGVPASGVRDEHRDGLGS